MTPERRPEEGNFISEWFGHRIFPNVVGTAPSVRGQTERLCPFLSAVQGSATQCVKNEKSKGVCTISSCSNGPRQDWVACPYRILEPSLVTTVGRRLYSIDPAEELYATAAPTLAVSRVRRKVRDVLKRSGRVIVYFDQKIGGEISVSGTSRSPEMAFDVTLVELQALSAKLTLGKFGILEVQTMDFHGSYGRAVQKLRNALELHPRSFPSVLRDNQWWAGDGIEGPNIANVFKRTFYQMMFKFSFGLAPSCAGTALTIPASVWDSWQPFLAAPDLRKDASGEYHLHSPELENERAPSRAWIYVVDFDANAATTPSPMHIVRVIQVSARALAQLALKVAPEAASAQMLSATGVYSSLVRRLGDYWPDAIIGP